MTQNIHVRFVGSADLNQVHKELNKVTTEISAMSAAIAATANSGAGGLANVKWLDNFGKKLDTQRHKLNTSIMAMDDFGVRSLRVADHVDTLTERIKRQKFTVGDLVREHKNLRDVYRQQLANRQSTVMEWGRNGDGSANVDVITRNRNAAEFGSGIKNLRTEMGFYNHILGVVSDNTVKWGKNTQWAGRQLTAGLSMPLLAGAAGAGALAYEMDKGLTQVVKVYGDAATALTTSDERIRQSTMITTKYLAANYGQASKDSIEITAQLAATGKTGNELQKSTIAVSKARLLGELDLQDAMKATTTLQSVYGMQAKELGDTFNYMNSMENQTVLTMQDFVVGIPKVSGVMKELGGNVQDVGVLLAAMKISGIDAAEGANAIKSIAFKVAAPNKGTRDMFEAATGSSFADTVKGTTDVTKRLVLLGNAMRDLPADERVGLISKMFGIYQGSKALSIISQLTDGSEQMNRALEVSAQTTAEWGATAERELEKLTGSNWNKLQQSWQSLKIDLAEVGDVFLEMAVPVLDWMGDLVKMFTGLDKSTQKWIARITLIAAAFGPIVMLVGLLGNMVGTMGKITSWVTKLVLPFKMLNAEEVAASKITEKNTQSINTQATAYKRLADMISLSLVPLQRSIAMQQQAAGIVAPHRVPGAVGNWQGGAPTSNSAILITDQAEKTKRAWSGTASNVAMFAAIGVPAATSMATESGSTMNNWSNIALTAAMLAPAIGKIPLGKLGTGVGKVGTSIKGWGASIAGVATTALPKIGGALAAVGSSVAAVAGPIALTVGAIGAAYYILHKNMEKSRKNMVEFSDSAKGYAEALGFEYMELGSKVDAVGNKITSLAEKTEQWKEKNKGTVSILEEYIGADEPEQLQAAVGEALKAALHGATPEQAEEAGIMAWKIMNAKLGENEMRARIKGEVDFSDNEQVVQAKINDLARNMKRAVNNEFAQGKSETFLRWFTGGGDMNTESKQAIENSVKEAMQLVNSVSETERPKVMKDVTEMLGMNQKGVFDSILAANREQFLKHGIKTMDDLRKQQAKNALSVMGGQKDAFGLPTTSKPDFVAIKLSAEQTEALARAQEEEALVVQTLLANTNGLTEERKRGITTIQQWIEATTTQNTAMKDTSVMAAQWKAEEAAMATSGYKWTEQLKLARLNTLRLQAGLSLATNSAQGFGDAIDDTANKLEGLGRSGSQTRASLAAGLGSHNVTVSDPDKLFSAYKDSYTTATGFVFSEAARLAGNQQEAMDRAISDGFDRARDNLDKQAEAASKAFDRRTKSFEKAWESRMDGFSKKWDKRKASTEAKYDSAIQKIKDQIKAEQDAEAIRQRIFEAEKTRLSRMAEMQNRLIDFNAALNTGNVDEAAKISNDMAATNTGWVIDDAAAAGEGASQTKVETLEAKIESLEKRKEAELKSMDDIEAREKKQLEDRKEREQDLLAAKKEAMEKAWSAKKKDLERQQAIDKADIANKRERERALFEYKLETLKAWVPKDEKELAQHTAAVEKAYKEYGIDLKKQGKEWGGVVGTALQTSVATARTRMSNDVQWEAMGRVAAEGMTKGAFNMTLSQFIKWVANGETPKNLAVGYTGKAVRMVNGKWVASAGGTTMHEGGVIGKGPGKRTGFTGNTLSPSEVMTNTLLGEAVLNRRATRNLGEDFIEKVNRYGALPTEYEADPRSRYGVGGDLVGGINGALGTGALMAAFKQGIISGAGKKMSEQVANGGGMIEVGSAAGQLFPGGWQRPANGPRTSPYGMRFHPILKQWRLHGGSDIGAPTGTVIRAAKGGTVAFAGTSGSFGNHTIINHGAGIQTSYSHQNRIGVSPGQKVATGQQIGNVGTTGRSTGPHLHFQYIKNGQRLNPNMIIPGLDVGGFVVKDGLANLHEGEKVLTKPLTENLDRGLDRLANGETSVQNTITFTGDINGIDDLERAMIEVMNKIENRKGSSRRVGGGVR